MRLFFLSLFLFFTILISVVPFLVNAAENCPEGYVCIDNPLKATSIEGIICGIVNLLTTIAIPLGIVILIWGGIQIITAGGSEEKVTQGKKTIMWTVVGVAIVLLVKFIIGFVIEILGGTPPSGC